MARRSRETWHRRTSLKMAALVAAGAAALAACGSDCNCPLTEPIPTYPVPTTETVTPTQLPGDGHTVAPIPTTTYKPGVPAPTVGTAETSVAQNNPNAANSTMMRVCLGGFYDKLSQTFTVNPVTEQLPDPSNYKNLVDFPKILHLVSGGNSSFEPAQPYHAEDRAWYDEFGNDMGTGSPSNCADRLVRVTTVNMAGKTGPQLTLASPDVNEGQVVDVTTPGLAEKSGLYTQQYTCANDQTVSNYARQLQAA